MPPTDTLLIILFWNIKNIISMGMSIMTALAMRMGTVLILFTDVVARLNTPYASVG